MIPLFPEKDNRQLIELLIERGFVQVSDIQYVRGDVVFEWDKQLCFLAYPGSVKLISSKEQLEKVLNSI